MEAGLYNEKDELIKNWQALINKSIYLSKNHDRIIVCSRNLEGKLKIDESVELITVQAFGKCIGLKEIILPQNLKSINEQAFVNCKNLENIIIPDNVTNIGPYAFHNCDKLEIVKLPNNLKKLSENLFAGCNKITEITIPQSVKQIEREVFANCDMLKQINYWGGKQQFKQIEGWQNIFIQNNLSIENIKFQKTLEDLINEGKSIIQANKIIKEQQER